MNMKTLRKILAVICMMALVVCISVGATIAYLMDDDVVTNTFTVGQVGISLDEADVMPDGTKETDARVQENVYHLLPGHEYIMDPTVHVDETSESCWLFVKVENDIAAIEANAADDANYKNIAAQIEANGWTLLTEGGNVYYRLYTKGEERDVKVFENFKISGSVDNDELAKYETKTSTDADGNEVKSQIVAVTAYAIQLDGFEGEPLEAWKAGGFAAK